MIDYFSNQFFLIALTFGVYFFGKLLRKWTGWVIMNPILITIVVLIAFLKLTGISYETYNEGGHLIEFWSRRCGAGRAPLFAVGHHPQAAGADSSLRISWLRGGHPLRCLHR